MSDEILSSVQMEQRLDQYWSNVCDFARTVNETEFENHVAKMREGISSDVERLATMLTAVGSLEIVKRHQVSRELEDLS